MSWKNEYWETLSHDGDKEIMVIFGLFEAKEITLKELFQKIEQLPYDFDDVDLAKETTYKVFEHLVKDFGVDMEEAQYIYDSVRMVMEKVTRDEFSETEIENNPFLKRYFNENK